MNQTNLSFRVKTLPQISQPHSYVVDGFIVRACDILCSTHSGRVLNVIPQDWHSHSFSMNVVSDPFFIILASFLL